MGEIVVIGNGGIGKLLPQEIKDRIGVQGVIVINQDSSLTKLKKLGVKDLPSTYYITTNNNRVDENLSTRKLKSRNKNKFTRS